jgi:hypothetical protein
MLSFILRYGILRIEDAIPMEKHPQATFRNLKTSVVRVNAIWLAKYHQPTFLIQKTSAVRHATNHRYNNPNQQVTLLHLAGYKCVLSTS